MNRAPSISIVVPAHNSGSFLSATLTSIQAQSVQDWECVVVDDGSADDTAQIAERHAETDSRIRVIRQPKSGASAARNRGFAEIDPASIYITFMDSDDIWLPDALNILREELERHPDAPGVHGLAELIDENGQPRDEGKFPAFGRSRLGYDGQRIVEWPVSEPTTFATLLVSNRVFPQGLLLMRKMLFAQSGQFDVNVRLVEDWDMLLRLSRLGDIRFVDRVILYYRRHRGNMSTADHHANREAARMMHHRIFFAVENDERQRQLLRKTWRAWQSYLARETWRQMRHEVGCGRLHHAPWRVAQLFLQLHRYVRGYPTLNGL
jgi:glycosyltransferase involved in cell wall biosynthesis